eukprot:5547517-Amphidinium_carterae.1
MHRGGAFNSNCKTGSTGRPAPLHNDLFGENEIAPRPKHKYRTRQQCPNIKYLINMDNFQHVDLFEEIVEPVWEEATWTKTHPSAKNFLCTRAPGPA